MAEHEQAAHPSAGAGHVNPVQLAQRKAAQMMQHDDVPYMPEEDEYILKMRRKGAAYRTIAFDLDRPTESIKRRAKLLEGTKKLRSAGTHTGAQRK